VLALLQRVNRSEVLVNDKTVGKISKGILVFLGVAPDDNESDCNRLAKRIVDYRIFEDSENKMNLSLKDISGEILIVSQFTLLADTKKGLRPSFSQAANPQIAERLYKHMIACLKSYDVKVEAGVFKAHMLLKIENDGPATFILKSK